MLFRSGNYYARRRALMLRKLLEFQGLDPARIQMSWVSASEGAKWATIIAEMTEALRALGPAGYAAPTGERSTATGRPPDSGGNGHGDEGWGSVVEMPRLRFDTACEHGHPIDERRLPLEHGTEDLGAR